MNVLLNKLTNHKKILYMKKEVDTVLLVLSVLLLILFFILQDPFILFFVQIPSFILLCIQVCTATLSIGFFIIFIKKHTLYIYSGVSRFKDFKSGTIFQIIKILPYDDKIIMKGCGHFLKNKIYIFKNSEISIDQGAREGEYFTLIHKSKKQQSIIVSLDSLPYSTTLHDIHMKKVIVYFMKENKKAL
ncbi:MAG: hypothetical protein ACI9AR_000329 [Flavobacteriaceae bacterium]|jgi:hypothetical protein